MHSAASQPVRRPQHSPPPPPPHMKLACPPELAPPLWVDDLPSERFTLVTARVANVPELSPRRFEQETFEAYVSIAEQLAAGAHQHPVRFWNHVPFITDPADAGRDNYMVFNAGRFRAFSDWYGGPARGNASFKRRRSSSSRSGSG